jgi:hypothetical protein
MTSQINTLLIGSVLNNLLDSFVRWWLGWKLCSCAEGRSQIGQKFHCGHFCFVVWRLGRVHQYSVD